MVDREFWRIVVVVFALTADTCKAAYGRGDQVMYVTSGTRSTAMLNTMKKYAREVEELGHIRMFGSNHESLDDWNGFQCVIRRKLLDTTAETVWRKVSEEIEGEDISVFVSFQYLEFPRWKNDKEGWKLMEAAAKQVTATVIYHLGEANGKIAEIEGSAFQKQLGCCEATVTVAVYVRKSPFLLGTMDVKGMIEVSSERASPVYTQAMDARCNLCQESRFVSGIVHMVKNTEAPKIAKPKTVSKKGKSVCPLHQIVWSSETLQVEIFYFETEQAQLIPEEDSTDPRPRYHEYDYHGPLRDFMLSMLSNMLCVVEKKIQSKEESFYVPISIKFGPLQAVVKNKNWSSDQFVG